MQKISVRIHLGGGFEVVHEMGVLHIEMPAHPGFSYELRRELVSIQPSGPTGSRRWYDVFAAAFNPHFMLVNYTGAAVDLPGETREKSDHKVARYAP
jgi:hypothetical protein